MARLPVIGLALSGIGGMGSVYVSALLDAGPEDDVRIVGAADPEPERCPRLEELKAQGIPVYPSFEALFSEQRPDLSVISSPIHFHALQTRLALSRGSCVLCEKPAAATIQEVRAMQAAEAESRGWVGIGFQWSYSPAIQALKKDILRGDFGGPRRLRCLYLWPRNEAYFRRSDWAGKQRDGRGRWILDSPAHNAMAHDLHNMFYVLGPSIRTSAVPVEVEAELYRAYAVENFDTAAIRCRTSENVEILFFVSHVSWDDRGPVFRYEFDNAVVSCNRRGGGIRAELGDGTRRDYGDPDADSLAKLRQAVAAARNGEPPVCGLEAAASQVLCVNGAQDSMPEIASFPAAFIRKTEDAAGPRLHVDGLDEVLRDCCEQGLLPSELGAPWSRKGRKIPLDGYTSFPSFRAKNSRRHRLPR